MKRMDDLWLGIITGIVLILSIAGLAIVYLHVVPVLIGP